MASLTSDPWDWEAHEVAQQLFHSDRPWSLFTFASHPPVSFADALKAEDVNGQSLLNDIDQKTLREEPFMISTFGQRSAILRAIETLRNESPKYVAHRSRINQTTERAYSTTPTADPSRLFSLSTPSIPAPNQQAEQTIQAWSSAVEPGAAVPERSQFVVPDAQGHKRRRIQPTTISSPDVQPLLKINVPEDSHTGYLGREALNLNEMFWPGAEQGDTLDIASDDDDDEFELFSTPVPVGQQRFIKSRIQHYLRRQFIEVDSDGKRAIASAYPKHLVKDGSSQAATIIVRDDDGCKFKRGNAIFLDYDVPGIDMADSQWDYLLDRTNLRDLEELPSPDDLQSLESYSESLLAEMEAERLEADKLATEEAKSNYLSPLDVDAAIDTALEAFEEKWRENKLPRREIKASSIWRQARGRNHFGLEDATRREAERLKNHLLKLRKAVRGEVWTTSSQVIKQCSIMEVTVHNLKDALWKLDLWKRPLCPAAILPEMLVSKPVNKPKPTRRQDESGDGESLHSDSSIALFEVDDLNDFMDIDEVPVPMVSDTRRTGKPSLAYANGSQGPISTLESSQPIKEEPPLSSPLTPRPTFRGSPYIMSLSPDEEMSPEPRSSRSAYDGFDSLPEDASDEQISSWTWQTLEERNDRKRIVLKLLHSMDSFNRQLLMSHMFYYSRIDNIKESAKVGLNLCKSDAYLKPNQARTSRVRMARLFLCWVAAEGSLWENKLRDLSVVERALNGLETDFGLFYEFIGTLKLRFGDAAGDDGEDEDEEEAGDAIAVSTPKKPQRKVKESKRGKDLRAGAAARREEDELQMQKNIVDLESSQGPIQELQTAINLGKKDDEHFIFISSLVASRIKDHQLDGIRFMWREITTDGDAAQGCLLAHTMGLGKTMQTITVLATIAEAAASSKLRAQLPQSLKDPKFLILCPPGLVENWKAEFAQWVPSGSAIGRPLAVGDVAAESRAHVIQKWYSQKAGVLLLGYELFRSMIVNKPEMTGEPSYSPADHELLLEMLLNGPSVVVADEAHKMKNHATGIGMTTKRFRTVRRIALTGSPLANNLMEYYAMIDWVAPDFLGDREEFSRLYQKPIEKSTYKDSTKAEQRTGLKKLKLLRLAIQDKISRADITALKDTLPPKTEFVIHIALTPMQKLIYATAVTATLSGQVIKTASIFGFIAFLRILCTHPSAFAKKLLSAPERSKNKAVKKDEDEIKAVRSQLTDQLGQRSRDLLAQPGHDAVELSNKMVIIMKILSLAKAANEGVLLFSQSLDILNYTENVLAKTGVRYRRLDGNTKMSDRQSLAKAFNSAEFDVFLVSTRAGGLGLNMPAANRVILVDFSFDPTIEEQAVGRAYRIGQTKPVFVYHLVAGGTFEEPLHHLTIFKKQLASRTVDHKTPGRAGMKMKDYIFAPKDVEPLSTSEYDAFRGKDVIMDKLLSDEAIASVICGITTAETLHVDIDEKLTAEEEGEVSKMFEVETLRKRDPAEYQRRKYANLLPNDPDYDEAIKLQMAQLAESHARHGGTLAGLANSPSKAAAAPATATTETHNTTHSQSSKQAQYSQKQQHRPPSNEQQATAGTRLNVWRHVLGPIMDQPAVIRLRTERPNLSQEMLNLARRILVQNPSIQTDWESFKVVFDAEAVKKQTEQRSQAEKDMPVARVSSDIPAHISEVLGSSLSQTPSARQFAVEHLDASRDELLAAQAVLFRSTVAKREYETFEQLWKEECRKINAQKESPTTSPAPTHPRPTQTGPVHSPKASPRATPAVSGTSAPARFSSLQHNPWQASMPPSLSPAELARRAAAMRTSASTQPEATAASPPSQPEDVTNVDSLMREPKRPGQN